MHWATSKKLSVSDLSLMWITVHLRPENGGWAGGSITRAANNVLYIY
jgi:hypothetical protein